MVVQIVKPYGSADADFAETAESKRETGWKVAQPDDDLIRGKWWGSMAMHD